MKNKINPLIVVTGLVIGAAAVILTKLGNPANMGFCIACFIRDIAGSTKFHTAAVVQYVRPEIIGIVVGSLIMALASGEFRAKAGSSPVTRFILGAIVMMGALMFLGCPLRMVIRMGGGDLNAFVGLAGFAIGIVIGIIFLKAGFGLKKNYDVSTGEGLVLPIVLVVLFVAAIVLGVYSLSADAIAAADKKAVAAGVFSVSTSGPGSMHAPFIIALIIALIVGALAQKSRMCMVGGIRDIIMFKNFNLIIGFVAVFVAVIVGNIIVGKAPVFTTMAKPIAHSNQIYNLIGMIMVGWGSCLLGGCPLRQLILTGEGNADSAITVLGMLVGAAIAHNFGIAGGADAAATADTAYKVYEFGKFAMPMAVIGIITLLAISLLNRNKVEK